MCGRDYFTYTAEDLRFRYLSNKTWPWPIVLEIPSFKPNYNMCPTQIGLVLSVSDGKLSFREMRWGLVPSWAKTVKDADKYSMINAKSEEITEKRSYKAAFQKRRCLIPISGFFEWKRSGTLKQPFAIFLKDRSIMSLAGIWESWVGKDTGEVVQSFSIITTSSNSYMAKIHNRMPVILNAADEEQWLDPSLTDTAKVMPLMKPCEEDLLDSFEVSAIINSPKNNSLENLRPVSQK